MVKLLTAIAGLAAVFTPLVINAAEATDLTPERHVHRQVHMGVEFTIILYSPTKELAEQAAREAFERITAIDRALSDYLPDSEVNRLCAKSPTAEPVAVGDDLFRVLNASAELSEASGGAFDATVGPLTKVWRRARRQKELPPAEDLAEARKAVGYKNILIHESNRTVELKQPRMRLDFGGIAKGYAADEALATIRRLGITQALVQASGDIAVGDAPPDLPGWKVALAPLNPDDPPTQFLWLKNQAISTSGDSRQHLVIKGERYSHILDPRTGEPIRGRSSVSVVAPSGLIADGIATAIDVLGASEGLKLLSRYPRAAASITTEVNGRQDTTASQNWSEATVMAPATKK